MSAAVCMPVWLQPYSPAQCSFPNLPCCPPKSFLQAIRLSLHVCLRLYVCVSMCLCVTVTPPHVSELCRILANSGQFGRNWPQFDKSPSTADMTLSPWHCVSASVRVRAYICAYALLPLCPCFRTLSTCGQLSASWPKVGQNSTTSFPSARDMPLPGAAICVDVSVHLRACVAIYHCRSDYYGGD